MVQVNSKLGTGIYFSVQSSCRTYLEISTDCLLNTKAMS